MPSAVLTGGECARKGGPDLITQGAKQELKSGGGAASWGISEVGVQEADLQSL